MENHLTIVGTRCFVKSSASKKVTRDSLFIEILIPFNIFDGRALSNIRERTSAEIMKIYGDRGLTCVRPLVDLKKPYGELFTMIEKDEVGINWIIRWMKVEWKPFFFLIHSIKFHSIRSKALGKSIFKPSQPCFDLVLFIVRTAS